MFQLKNAKTALVKAMLDDCLLIKPLSVHSRVFLSVHTGVISGPELGAQYPGNQAGFMKVVLVRGVRSHQTAFIDDTN